MQAIQLTRSMTVIAAFLMIGALRAGELTAAAASFVYTPTAGVQFFAQLPAPRDDDLDVGSDLVAGIPILLAAGDDVSWTHTYDPTIGGAVPTAIGFKILRDTVPFTDRGDVDEIRLRSSVAVGGGVTSTITLQFLDDTGAALGPVFTFGPVTWVGTACVFSKNDVLGDMAALTATKSIGGFTIKATMAGGGASLDKIDFKWEAQIIAIATP